MEENSSNSAGVEHVKKMYARQRAKDLAEHAKALLSKEKELDELKKEISTQKNGPDFPVCVMILIVIIESWEKCACVPFWFSLWLYWIHHHGLKWNKNQTDLKD